MRDPILHLLILIAGHQQTNKQSFIRTVYVIYRCIVTRWFLFLFLIKMKILNVERFKIVHGHFPNYFSQRNSRWD